jgi:hypothetical protein
VVATLALNPRELLNEESPRSIGLTLLAAPTLLEHAPNPGPRLAPVRQATELTAVHRLWAQLHDVEPRPSARGLRARLRRRLVTTGERLVGPALTDERELVGGLIRASEALAVRCDELAGRVECLEDVLVEVVNVVSEDLIAVRAVLERAHLPTPPGDNPERPYVLAPTAGGAGARPPADG